MQNDSNKEKEYDTLQDNIVIKNYLLINHHTCKSIDVQLLQFN